MFYRLRMPYLEARSRLGVTLLALFCFLHQSSCGAEKLADEVVAQWSRGNHAGAIRLCRTSPSGAYKFLEKAIEVSRIENLDPRTCFNDLSKFVQRNPNWPQTPHLLEYAASIMHMWSDNEICNWCAKHPPESARGKKLFALAYARRHSNLKPIVDVARDAWVSADFSPEEEKLFLSKFSSYLSHSHAKQRVHRMLMHNSYEKALQCAKLLPMKDLAEVETCVSLANKAWDPSNTFMQLARKKALTNEMLYSFASTHEGKILKDKHLLDKVIARLDAIKEAGSYSLQWDKLRTMFARSAFCSGSYEITYKLAKKVAHRDLRSPAQFLAGWVCLKHKNKPKLALAHFRDMEMFATIPYSIAKSCYWQGITLKKLRLKQEAKKAFTKAARHFHSFYGQLALLELGTKKFPELSTPYSAHKLSDKRHEELLKVALLLVAQDRFMAAEAITRYLFSSLKSKEEAAYLAHRLHLEQDKIYRNGTWNMVVGEMLASKGVLSVKDLFPIPMDLAQEMPGQHAEMALRYALVKRESAFNQNAKSCAGAMGLMQLMEATAISTAKAHGLYKKDTWRQCMEDPRFNLKLGTLHLRDLMRSYNNNYVLCLSAYNAGPLNTERWIGKNGDPRAMKSLEAVVDWVEKISFRETRMYVQEILASKAIYSALLGEERAITLSKDLLRGAASGLGLS